MAFGAVDLAIFLYPLGYVAVWPAAVGMVVVGFPGALTIAGALTLLQRNTEDSYRGRVFGALDAVEGVAILAGTSSRASSPRWPASCPSWPSRAGDTSWPGWPC